MNENLICPVLYETTNLCQNIIGIISKYYNPVLIKRSDSDDVKKYKIRDLVLIDTEYDRLYNHYIISPQRSEFFNLCKNTTFINLLLLMKYGCYLNFSKYMENHINNNDLIFNLIKYGILCNVDYIFISDLIDNYFINIRFHLGIYFDHMLIYICKYDRINLLNKFKFLVQLNRKFLLLIVRYNSIKILEYLMKNCKILILSNVVELYHEALFSNNYKIAKILKIYLIKNSSGLYNVNLLSRPDLIFRRFRNCNYHILQDTFMKKLFWSEIKSTYNSESYDILKNKFSKQNKPRSNICYTNAGLYLSLPKIIDLI